MKLITILVLGDFDETRITKFLPKDSRVLIDEFNPEAEIFEFTARFDKHSDVAANLEALEMDGVIKRQENL